MSYSKPKQISTGALELNNTLLKETLKDSDQQEANRQARNTQNISALVNTGLSLVTESIAPKADALSELNKDYQKQTQKLYNKVGSAAYDTGFEGTDKKADVFMNGLIDDYYRIKNSIKDMKDPSLGQQDLAMIENMVNQYGEGVTNMVAFNSEIEKATKADLNSGGKLSNTGAPAAQLQIIRKISGGGAEAEDIEFRREGGNIMLYDRTTKQTLNITEFNKAQQAGEQYLKFAIPTEETTSGFFKTIIEDKSEGGTFLEKYTTKNDKGGFSMTTQQQADYKNDIIGKEPGSDYATGGMFEGLLAGDGNAAESIWEDQMFDAGISTTQWPNGEENDTVYSGKTSDQIIEAAKRPNATEEEKELYKLFYKDFYEPALGFLADQSLQGANELQITLDEEQEENTEGQKQEEEIVNNEQTGAGGVEVNDNKTGNTEVVKEEEVLVKNFYDSNTDIEKPVYKNKKGEDVDFEQDSNTFLTNIETTYGGYDGDEGTAGIPSYGDEDDTRVDDHLNSTKVLPGKSGAYFDGTDKKGLKADIGEDVYNALSDSEKAILRMEHLNVGWNPKVLMLQTAGIISKDDRGKYHKPQNQKDPSKWDVNKLYEENKDEIAALLKGKDSVMLENLEAIYKGTDNSKNGNSEEQNKKRNKGYQTQYTRRIADIKDRYKMPDVVKEEKESNEQLAEQFED